MELTPYWPHVRQCRTLWDLAWKFYVVPTGVPKKMNDGCSPARLLLVRIIWITRSASCSPSPTQCAYGHVTWCVLAGMRPIAKTTGARKVNEPFSAFIEFSFGAKGPFRVLTESSLSVQ